MDQPAEKAIRDYKKGDEVNAVVLAIDPERERISLGIKQLDADPIPQYLEQHPRGTNVTGKVTQVDDKLVYLQFFWELSIVISHHRILSLTLFSFKRLEQFSMRRLLRLNEAGFICSNLIFHNPAHLMILSALC